MAEEQSHSEEVVKFISDQEQTLFEEYSPRHEEESTKMEGQNISHTGHFTPALDTRILNGQIIGGPNPTNDFAPSKKGPKLEEITTEVGDPSVGFDAQKLLNTSGYRQEQGGNNPYAGNVNSLLKPLIYPDARTQSPQPSTSLFGGMGSTVRDLMKNVLSHFPARQPRQNTPTSSSPSKPVIK